jgi:hypothetical protein
MEFVLPPLLMIGISAAYFGMQRTGAMWPTRVFVSLHGLSATILYFSAMAAWAIVPTYRPWALVPFAVMYLIPLASIVYSFFRFDGPRTLHLLQVINIGCMLLSLLIGAMAITGQWL